MRSRFPWPVWFRRGFRAPTQFTPPAIVLSVSRQPAGATDALAFTTQPQVATTPATAGLTIVASIISGSGVLVGTASAVTNGSGVATWANLGIDATSPPSPFTLQFASSGLNSVNSGALTVIPPALTMVRQPGDALDTLAFGTQPQVALPSPLANVAIAADILTGTGTLLGTVTALTNASGIATWANLAIDAPSTPTNFTLRFTASGYAAVASDSFPVTAPVVGGLFPMSPTAGVGGWSLVADEVDWDYTHIPIGSAAYVAQDPVWNEPDLAGCPYRDYSGPNASIWSKGLTLQANAGATQLRIEAPSDTTIRNANAGWVRNIDVVSSAGWTPYDEWSVAAAGVAVSAQTGDGATGPNTITGDLFIAPGATQPGQAVTFVNRLVPGMQVRIGTYVPGNPVAPFEVATIASVPDRYTVNLTAPLQNTWPVGTQVYRWFGRCTSLVVDPTKPGGSGKVLNIRFPAGFHGGYSPGKAAYNGSAPTPNICQWDYTLCTGTIYVASWRKLSPGWSMQNGRIVGQKMIYLFSKNVGNDANWSIAHMVDYLETQDIGGVARLLSQFQPQGPFDLGITVPNTAENDTNDGEWHLMEMIVEPNTGDLDNGRCRIWMDSHLGGANLVPKVDSSQSTSFTAAQTRTYSTIDLDPIYGGGMATITAEQWLRYGPTRIMVK